IFCPYTTLFRSKKKKGISIGPALVDIMTASSSESNDYFLRQLFRSVRKSGNYIRIEPNNLSSIDPSMDAASKINIQKIVTLADKLISENEQTLHKLAVELIADQKEVEKRKKSVWNFLNNK